MYCSGSQTLVFLRINCRVVKTQIAGLPLQSCQFSRSRLRPRCLHFLKVPCDGDCWEPVLSGWVALTVTPPAQVYFRCSDFHFQPPLDPCCSDSTLPSNHLEVLLNCRVWFNRSGRGPRACDSNKLPGDTEAPGLSLRTVRLQESPLDIPVSSKSLCSRISNPGSFFLRFLCQGRLCHAAVTNISKPLVTYNSTGLVLARTAHPLQGGWLSGSWVIKWLLIYLVA